VFATTSGIVVDTTKPAVRITNPIEGVSLPGVTILVQGTAIDNPNPGRSGIRDVQ
jgi:hypothetical protein